MKILIACEESQRVCMAFREKGHEAYSCDILECTGLHPEYHIQDDVLKIIKGSWDMVIAFPPCTDIANAGGKWFAEKKKDGRQQAAINFFMAMIEAPAKYVCVENPQGIMSTVYRRPDQIIHPYYFGDPFQKATCLWLKNLPKLVHVRGQDLFSPGTHVDSGEKVLVFHKGRQQWQHRPKWSNNLTKKNRGFIKSKTFPGIAKAMADQWG